MTRRIGAFLKDAGAMLSREDGASMIVVMIVAVGLFLMVPVFVDYASLHYTRRVTQTGADAAALAAAISYANHLSINLPYGDSWPGWIAGQVCCFGQLCHWNWRWSRLCSIGAYSAYAIAEGNRDSIGRGAARDYAGRNGTTVTSYAASAPAFYEAPRVHFMSWIPILPVSVEVEARRRAPMIYGSLYGRNNFYVYAHARAEAYMDRYSEGVRLCAIICCACNPWFCVCPSVVPSFRFNWKVRLVE